jgi:hypothetical protein
MILLVDFLLLKISFTPEDLCPFPLVFLLNIQEEIYSELQISSFRSSVFTKYIHAANIIKKFSILGPVP